MKEAGYIVFLTGASVQPSGWLGWLTVGLCVAGLIVVGYKAYKEQIKENR